jgi:hypothetical protein
MKQFLETKNNYLIGVATDNWRERIERGLPRYAEGIYWYDNVYEATAAAVNLGQKGRSILLMVMIDCLSREEMGVFATLAGMDEVWTAAVSGTGNQLKMRQAESLGADKIVLLSKLSQLGAIEKTLDAEAELPITETEPLVTETEPLDTGGEPSVTNDLPKKIIQEHPSEIQKGATQPSRPRRKPPAIEREENQPLLTPEELDALLG